MSEKLKKLTGKNPNDFEPVAYNLINDTDVELFAELVEKEDFLFDFVKQNVATRIKKACNNTNFHNLISFLNYYSPSYEDAIISILAKYADEDLTDEMLDLLENGTENQKTYAAKYFSHIQDPLAIEQLRANAYSENSYLSSNCIATLAEFKDEGIYNESLAKLESNDEFEKLEGVKCLVSYGNKNAVEKIIETIKKSSLAENMAAELPYLESIREIHSRNKIDGLYILNLITDGLGEISGLAQVFDFELYDMYENIIQNNLTPEGAAVILNAKDKFETLTENDEYLYDESKDTKQEIKDIKLMLDTIKKDTLQKYSDKELRQDSLFIYTALEHTSNSDKVRELIYSDNQTIVLKSVEILKKLGTITTEDKNNALKSVSNENIKNVIMAI